MSKLKGTPIPDDFQPNESTLAWLEKRYPQIDVEIAVERFLAWSTQYAYQNHQRVFQGFVMREADNNKLGPMLKKVQTSIEIRKAEVAARGKAIGFRPPNRGEDVDAYEAAIDAIGKRDVASVMQLVKGFGK